MAGDECDTGGDEQFVHGGETAQREVELEVQKRFNDKKEVASLEKLQRQVTQ